MKKKTSKLRKPTDATLRNVRASHKRIDALENTLAGFRDILGQVLNRVDAIERRQEAWSRQEVREERDNIEGWQTPQ